MVVHDDEVSGSDGTRSLTTEGYRRAVTVFLDLLGAVADGGLPAGLLAQDDDSLLQSFLGTNLRLPAWSIYLAAGINALAGAAFAARRGFDVIGVIGLGIAQGLGGLLLLSILLQTGVPFVLSDPRYILITGAAGILGFFFAAAISQALRLALVLDALAMGFLVSVGVNQSLNVQLNVMAAVFVGVLTGVGGLILRDIMAGIAPQVLRPGVYAGVVALVGALVFVGMVEIGATRGVAQLVTVLVVGVLRTLAVVLDWRTHKASDLSGRAWRYWEAGR